MGTRWLLRFYRRKAQKAKVDHEHRVPVGQEPHIYDGAEIVAAYNGSFDGHLQSWGAKIARALVAYEKSPTSTFDALECSTVCLETMRADEIKLSKRLSKKYNKEREPDTSIYESEAPRDAQVDYLYDEYVYDVYVDAESRRVLFDVWTPTGYAAPRERGLSCHVCVSAQTFLRLSRTKFEL